jgi:hypothetical protein
MPTDSPLDSDASAASAEAPNVHRLPQGAHLRGADFAERLAAVRLCYRDRARASTPEVALACVSIDIWGHTHPDTRGLDARTASAMLDAVARLYWRVHNVAHGRDEHARPRRRRLAPKSQTT